MLEQATSSDASVRSKWDEWEHNIVELMADEDVLEASIPSSANQRSTSSGVATHRHARSLRALLETSEDLRRTRTQVVARAKRLAEADDISPVIARKATAFEQFTKVEPGMFEDVSDKALEKYDRFVQEVKATETSQEDLLEQLRARNMEFLRSRRDDPALKEREHALQSLDLAYHKYREIKKNLDEGTKFYNGLATILTEYKEECESWSRGRKLEIRSLVHAIQNPIPSKAEPTHVPIAESAHNGVEAPQSDSVEREQQDTRLPISPISPPPKKKPTTLKFDESDDWEELKLPAAPVKSPEKSRTSTRKKIAVPRS